jgi:hydrogenase maturation protease
MLLLDSRLEGEAYAHPLAGAPGDCVLILGIGNVLMGDEGVGVHVLRQLEQQPALAGVRLLDGGTGGVNLLADLMAVGEVVLIDATRDGRPAGTITYLHPDRVGDLPRGLGAHDFGLKDLFAAAALIGRLPGVHLYTISVETIRPMCTELSPAVAAAVPPVAAAARARAAQLAGLAGVA